VTTTRTARDHGTRAQDRLRREPLRVRRVHPALLHRAAAAAGARPREVDLPPGDAPAGRWLALGEVHLHAVAERADLVVACLDQEPPDNGTVVEVAWAAAHGRPVLAYRGDLRQGGEEGLRYNLMIGAAIRRSGGVEVATLEDLDRELARLAA
jgi:nucleoside 2-deoxyribosyltransferase